ncbi:hypothetical protein V7V80_06585 [Pseudomonas kermanshahensis]|uniref:Uncharacterized protein n=1 Tax=Pseudomonas kermanshahensis TaxID=2745482 RepID=A0ABU8R397_9PSED|nr:MULTISPECIES: hypothetical protein [Pseudomonas]MBC3497105.1 hypothetical protein [Pseudomonas sp. SWRI67]MBV4527394.1 hypothetical protein [Pseudomonas kermanshahensis]WEL58256.1 hypothetical protein PZ739_11375 [Pseudomonas kermanshahensis]
MIMHMRFVVVPAVPRHKEIFPRRIGFPSALGEGYDLYDTQEKVRLSLSFSTRAEAEFECACRNEFQGNDDANFVGIG